MKYIPLIALFASMLPGAATHAQSTADSLSREARKAYERGDWDASLSLSNAALAVDGRSLEAHKVWQDVVQEEMGLSHLRQFYLSKIRREPGQVVWYYLMARLYRWENADTAKAFLRKAIQVDPAFVWAYIDLASKLKSEQSAREALSLLNVADSLRPGLSAVAAEKAEVYAILGDVQGAFQGWRRALSLDPTNAEYNFQYALVHSDPDSQRYFLSAAERLESNYWWKVRQETRRLLVSSAGRVSVYLLLALSLLVAVIAYAPPGRRFGLQPIDGEREGRPVSVVAAGLFALVLVVSTVVILWPPSAMMSLVRILIHVSLLIFLVLFFLVGAGRRSRQYRIIALCSAGMIIATVYAVAPHTESLWMSVTGLAIILSLKLAWLRRHKVMEWGWQEWQLLSFGCGSGLAMIYILPTMIPLSLTITLWSYVRSDLEDLRLVSSIAIVAPFIVNIGTAALTYVFAKGLFAILAVKGVKPSAAWRVTLVCWIAGLVFLLMNALSLVVATPLKALPAAEEMYGLLSAVTMFPAFALFLLAPAYLLVTYGQGKKVVRIAFGAAAAVLVLILSNVGSSLPFAAGWSQDYYMLLARARLEYRPDTSDVVLLRFEGGAPAYEDLLNVTELLNLASPRAIVMPDWPFWKTDSLFRARLADVPLILYATYAESVRVSGAEVKLRPMVDHNLNTTIHGGVWGESVPTAYFPLYGETINDGVATVYEIRKREVGEAKRAGKYTGEEPTLSSVMWPRDVREWVGIDPYDVRWPNRGSVIEQGYWFPGPRAQEQEKGYVLYFEWPDRSKAYLNTSRMMVSDWDWGRGVVGAPIAEVPGIRGRILVLEFDRRRDWNDSRGLVTSTIIQNILDGTSITRPSRGAMVAGQFFLLVVAGYFIHVLKRSHSIGLIVLMLMTVAVGSAVLFAGMKVFVDPVPLAFVVVGAGILFLPFEIARERRTLQDDRVRLAQELRSAHDMQMGLMPKSDPEIPGFEFASVCMPASEVGGDFYDYVWLDKKRTKLGIAVADVSGKAMKAAMTAVMTSGMLYSETQKSESPREILQRINHPLYLRSDRRVFTAMGFAVINTKKRTMTFASAGQPSPIRVRNGMADELSSTGVKLPLGVQTELQYTESRLTLRRGDVIVFYTDGVVESMNEKKEMYGFERLMRDLERWHDFPAAAIKDRLVGEVRTFIGRAPQHDDVTIVVVRMT